MKKTIKIISILFLLTLLVFSTTTYVQASIEINPENYNHGTPSADGEQKALKMAGKILGFIRNIGVVVGVIGLSIIGLKYMLGSLDEKANYKENMRIYIAGFALLLAGTTIPSIIYSIFN